MSILSRIDPSLRSLPADLRVVREKIPVDRIEFLNEPKTDPDYPWDRLTASIRRGWIPHCESPSLHADRNSEGYTPFVVVPDGDVFRPLQGWHRVQVLRKLRRKRIDAFVVRPWEVVDPHLLSKAAFDYASLPSRVQTIRLPDGSTLPGRDDSLAVWESSGWRWTEWCGRSVVDIGCAAGAHGLEAMRHGAERVLGIDTDIGAVDVARSIAWSLGVDEDQWKVRHARLEAMLEFRADIVMAHQCLYWLSDPPTEAWTHQRMLDVVCGSAQRYLFALTLDQDAPHTGPERGWRPTRAELESEFERRGLRVEWKDRPLREWPTKRTLVATRVAP